MTETMDFIPAQPGTIWIARNLADPDALEKEFNARFPECHRETYVSNPELCRHGSTNIGEPIIGWTLHKNPNSYQARTHVGLITPCNRIFDCETYNHNPGNRFGGIMLPDPDSRVYVYGEAPYASLYAFFEEAVKRARKYQKARGSS